MDHRALAHSVTNGCAIYNIIVAAQGMMEAQVHHILLREITISCKMVCGKNITFSNIFGCSDLIGFQTFCTVAQNYIEE